MTTPTTDRHGSRRRSADARRVAGIAVIAVGVVLRLAFAAAVHAGEPVGDVASCGVPGPVARVSYHGHERRLIREIVGLMERSPSGCPDPAVVARIFAACATEIGEPLAALHVAVDGVGRHLKLESDAGDRRGVPIDGGVTRLAQRVTRWLGDHVETSRRRDVEDASWFLWVRSLVRATGERHNSYDYVDELAAERAADRGRSFAVGFDIAFDEGRAVVTGVQDDELVRAGLSEGDRLIALDDRPIEELDLPELQRYWYDLRPFGFTARVQRHGMTFEVAGAAHPVRHATVVSARRGATGYVRIRRFARGTLVELRRALRRLEADGIARLVVDLRENPGGAMSAGLVDVFFKPGRPVVSYRDRGAADPVDVEATVEYDGLPVALLVDRTTASMAEALAAAFAIHTRGPIVGETTFGKGVGQSVYPVLDEGRLHLVERTYFYPGTRESWDGVGVPPTDEVAVDDVTRDRLRSYLESPVVRLDEQWDVDPVLRAATQRLEDMP